MAVMFKNFRDKFISKRHNVELGLNAKFCSESEREDLVKIPHSICFLEKSPTTKNFIGKYNEKEF